MAKLTSIFGDLAGSKNLQLMVDQSLARFNQPIWKRFFNWGVPSTTIDFKTVIGKARIEAAASVVDRNSSAPIRSRAGLAKLQGEIPAIKEKFQMDEKTFRDYQAIKGMAVSDQAKRDIMLDMIFNDIKTVGDAAHKRLDSMVLQALSSGKIQLTTTNNPDGIVTGEIDLLMPDDNKKFCSVVWSTTASADPIADFETVRDAFEAKGIIHAKAYMDTQTFSYFRKCDAVAQYVLGRKVSLNARLSLTIDMINEYLTSVRLPVIEVVNSIYGVEKSGVISTIAPWTTGMVTFVPAGPLGIIHNAIPIEKFLPVEKVSYAEYDRALISKWSDNDPFAEFTAVELNAFPGWETIDSCAILNTIATS